MEDDLFDVFRDDKPSLIWVGSTDSMNAAWELIKSKAVVPGERFIIYGVVTHNRFYLRAEDCCKSEANHTKGSRDASF